MTRKQIRNAVKELRDTLYLQWGQDSTMYRDDNKHLKKLATMAYKYATVEAKMLALDATLEAKDFTISCLREEIRRIRPELKDCIAAQRLVGRGTTIAEQCRRDQTTDPKRAAFTGETLVKKDEDYMVPFGHPDRDQ